MAKAGIGFSAETLHGVAKRGNIWGNCSFTNKRHCLFGSLMFKGRRLRPSEALKFARLSPLRPLRLCQFALLSDPPSFSSDFLGPAPLPLTPSPCLVFKLGAKLRPPGFRPNISPIVSASPPCGITHNAPVRAQDCLPHFKVHDAAHQRPKCKEKKKHGQICEIHLIPSSVMQPRRRFTDKTHANCFRERRGDASHAEQKQILLNCGIGCVAQRRKSEDARPAVCLS